MENFIEVRCRGLIDAHYQKRILFLPAIPLDFTAASFLLSLSSELHGASGGVRQIVLKSHLKDGSLFQFPWVFLLAFEREEKIESKFRFLFAGE